MDHVEQVARRADRVRAPLSTGSSVLDRALGGGLPAGEITEVYGPPSVGKTRLALRVIATTQRAGGDVFYLDTEHTYRAGLAEACGVLPGVLLARPESGERAFAWIEQIFASGGLGAGDLVVINTLAALLPEAELRARLGATAGAHEGMLGERLGPLARAARSSGCSILAVNQLREQGAGVRTPGGRAMAGAAAARVELAPGDGTETHFYVSKNTYAPPFARGVI